ARIAEAIVRQRRARPFRTSGELVEAIMSAVPRGYERGRIHPATRTFQALRIAVNREIENLESFLGFLPSVAAPGARAAVISFHSLEDKLVKRLFRILAAHGAATALTKKPLVPQETEVRENPRSRSAKLRAVKFLTTSH
ncbi:MAG: 16S rRNA (cytosine(1402)-N(4))-methyltransferase, partial [Patescibacteria group bacterium]